MNKTQKTKIYQAICEEAPDAILFADRQSVIRTWNKGAELMFGYSAEEVIGESLDLIIPENLRQRHNDGYAATMKSGHSKYGHDLLSVPAVHKDGRRLFCDFSIVMVKNDDGEMLGIASIMRDTTAQKAREKELRERIKELETKAG
ncbi:PAS domain S-box-containing protein [Malonomonas rubra DSM 5091]|uniref:PAS domain S-box-containing protein n=1 Tax=Malonomonas rubra DSM 5091 TaxID=1122189 RepID=A0A1M6NI75_MALRU|nr:PAS domain S-box protein [Malonomonas rubra]SHJ95373.1 PAS domain S-box-containing protein [Malonomonas rubra DSM 5091]